MTTSKPGTAERTQLVLANLDLCDLHAQRVWKWIHGRLPFDDLVQEGRLGLWLAAERYDPGRGAAFRTFADRVVRGRMLDFVRQWNHYRSERAVAIEWLELFDVHAAPDEHLTREAALDIEHLASLLTPQQQSRIRDHLELTAGVSTTREMAERHGVSEKAIHFRAHATRQLLKKTAGLLRKRKHA